MLIMKKLIVPQKYDNKKLTKFILDSFPKLSPNMLYKALRQKDIKIDGKFIETIQPFYQNGTLIATLNIPDETETGEWLISWGDLKTELVTILSDSVIVKKKYTKEIIQKQYGNN